MLTVHTIDLNFLDQPQVIAAYVLELGDSLAIVDPGPATTLPELTAGLSRLGYQLSDVRDVLLTHIHFDHAGAAWALAEAGARVHVHGLGAKHLANPERLWNSAARIYGEEGMAKLWGEMRPIKEGLIRVWAHEEGATLGQVELVAYHTPGHAKHHIAWQADNVLFTGDVGGVRIAGGPIEPPCPPPDIDLKLWKESLNLLRQIVGIDTVYRTHYGGMSNDIFLLQCLLLEETLERWKTLVKGNLQRSQDEQEARFVQAIETERSAFGDDISRSYHLANPAIMSVAGLQRYLQS